MSTELVQNLRFDLFPINIEHIPVYPDYKFGILNLITNSVSFNQEILEFVFTIDCSGSMSDICSDGKSKLNHIIYTLQNMIIYFKENSSIKVYITIHSFNSSVYEIVERTIITNDNIKEILKKIKKIKPNSLTNIELALLSNKINISKIKNEFPKHSIINIFMTDGQATDGNTNIQYLSSLVDNSVTNKFIGFGIEHDDILLNSLCNNINSSYYFIDKIEESGFVYGEILHEIVYKLFKDVDITVHNGLIYDFKFNKWGTSLFIDTIACESNKTYHIVSSNPHICKISLTATKISDLKIIITTTVFNNNYDNLIKYIYRQRTLQQLNTISDILKKKKNNI